MLSHLVPIVAVPARNEAQRLPNLLRALDEQKSWTSEPQRLQVVLVLNNTTDRSTTVVEQLIPSLTNIAVQLVETDFEPEVAHVGSARRLAMEIASEHMGDNCVILTTDADAVPSPDWVLQNLLAIENGADIVGGRIIGDPREEAILGAEFQSRAAKYARYAALCDELAATLDPIIHDPWPRHQDHTGGSLAVRAPVYRAVGGMPAFPFREDLGFVSRVLRKGFRLVHPLEVSVVVSARTEGRAPGGMADCVKSWLEDAMEGKPILVESPQSVEDRIEQRHAIRTLMDVTASKVAQLIEEQAASGLDVAGTVPIDLAIEHISRRLCELAGEQNAA